LLKAGVIAAGKAVDAAIANHCRAEDVVNVVAFYRLNSGAWEPSALYTRVMNLRPGQDCSELWPEKSPKFVAEKQREQSSRSQVAAVSSRAAAEKKRADDEKLLAEREAEFGSSVDAMTAEEIRSLIRRVFPSEADFMLKRFRGELPVSGLIRESILGYLAVAPKGPTSVLEAL
jgi:hypothetical protein